MYIQTPERDKWIVCLNVLSVTYFIEIPWGYHLPGWHNCCPTKSHTIENISEQYDLMNLIKDLTCDKGPTPSLFDVILVLNAHHYGCHQMCCDFPTKTGNVDYRSYESFNEFGLLKPVSSPPFHVSTSIKSVTWHGTLTLKTKYHRLLVIDYWSWTPELLSVNQFHTLL